MFHWLGECPNSRPAWFRACNIPGDLIRLELALRIAANKNQNHKGQGTDPPPLCAKRIKGEVAVAGS